MRALRRFRAMGPIRRPVSGVLLSVATLGIGGCASPELLNANGQRVRIVTTLTPADAAAYSEVSVVECFVPDQSLRFDEGCKNEMRNAGAARGGQLLVIELRDQTFCLDSVSSVSRPCGIRMIGRVYKKK